MHDRHVRRFTFRPAECHSEQLAAERVGVADLQAEREPPGGPESPGELPEPRGVADPLVARRIGAAGHRRRVAERLEVEPVEEVVEQDVVGIRRAEVPRVADVDRRVELHELAREQHVVLAGDEILPQLRLFECGRRLEQRVERTVLPEELRRRLLADTGDARHVVGAVAGQREEVDDPLRRHPEALLHVTRFHHARRLRRLPHRHHREIPADHLQQILVVRNDAALHAGIGRALSQRGHHVVGLVAFHLDARETRRVEVLPDQRHLRAEIVGHALACRLVVREHVVPERFSRRIEHDDERVGAE